MAWWRRGGAPSESAGAVATEDPAAFSVLGRKNFSGSMIGGIAETQEMLNFCGEHGIVCDIEMTTFDKVSEAWDRVVKGDVKYRFVLDTKSLGEAAAPDVPQTERHSG